MGSLLVWLLWGPMILIAISFQGNEWKMAAEGEAPRKVLEPRLFNLRKTPFLIQRGHYKKGFSVLLLKSTGVQIPRIARLARVWWIPWNKQMTWFSAMIFESIF